MTIACLGWGSLAWDPGDLPISSEWFSDGPCLPLEFARESRDGRMTLVIIDHDAPVPTLWSKLDVETMNDAVDALAAREKVEWKGSIGRWVRDCGDWAPGEIARWAEDKGLQGVVWTALKPGFRNKRGSVPSLSEVVQHLEGLPADARSNAVRYICSAPPQIVTPYRKTLEHMLA